MNSAPAGLFYTLRGASAGFLRVVGLMLASLFQFSFLCVVALANLGLGFAIASRLGWGPSLVALFQLDQAAPSEHLKMLDRVRGVIERAKQAAAPGTTADAEPSFDEPATDVELTSDNAGPASDEPTDSDPVETSELAAAMGNVA